jgi:hypothetical protein
MTDKELLALAVEFDGGHQPVLNMHYITPEHISTWSDSYSHHDFVCLAVGEDGTRRWKVMRNSHLVLNKKGWLEHESFPSSRTDKFFQRTRFDTLDEAFTALRRLHEKERAEWVKKVGRGTIPQNMAEADQLREAYFAREKAKRERKAARDSALQQGK